MTENPCKKCDDPAMGCSNTCGDLAEYRYIEKLEEELKQAKKLLQAAVEDITAIAEVHAAASPILCPQYGKYMKAIDVRTRKWQYADEALALIEGGST